MKDGAFSAIYVVYGKDRRRAADTVHEIADQVLAGADVQVALSTYEGPEASLAEVLDDVRTVPFLSPCRVVVVREADSFISKYRQGLEDYLDSPGATGVLVLAAESFPKTTRLAKRAVKIGKVIACEPAKPRELPGAVVEYARTRHGLSVSPQTAVMLIELAGDDWGSLCGEMDKLAAYVGGPDGGKKSIQAEDIEALVGNNRQYNVFTVIEAMTGGDAAAALARLDKMLGQDRQAEFTAVGAFAWHVRRLYNARLLVESGMADRAVTKQLRIWSQPDAFIRQVKQLSVAVVGDMLKELMRIDHASKTGVGTVRTGLEKLIVQFCRRRQRVA